MNLKIEELKDGRWYLEFTTDETCMHFEGKYDTEAEAMLDAINLISLDLADKKSVGNHE